MMPDREAHSKPASSAGAPSRNDSRNDTACGLCGEPITAGAPSRLHVANGPRDSSYVAHAKCIHERGMVERAMRAPQKR
jgi:hypothetical protein